MTFLSWLVDDNCFHIESDYNALSHDKARKCIAVAEMIISLHKNNFTPFNLGLTLQLYHGYGSKHLIETLHAFGICASYTEVRQFMTSAANHEIAKTEVSCIPYGISPKTLGGDFIQEGADNIDLNTETSGTSTKEASTSENLRSAFNLLAARIASATDIELLKTIFDCPCPF
jgi:hypothetical protein